MKLLQRIPVLLAVAPLLSTLTAAQAVHVVDAAGGPGSTSTTIGAAIASASDGDVVLVRSGFYAETVRLTGIGLVVQADAGASVTVQAIEVEGLGAAQFAALRGLARVNGDGHVTLRSNQGPVWIEDSPWSNSFVPFAPCSITDGASVTLRNAQFGICCLGGFTPAVDIQRSNVALYECQARGEDAGSSPIGAPGGPGIRVTDSRATLYGSTVFGGKGSDPTFGGTPGSGGPALVASGATIVELVGTTLTGGAGGKGPFTMGATGPAFQTFGGASVLTRPGRAHLLASASPVDSSATTTASFQGDPGDAVYVLVSASPGPFLPHPNWSGPLVVPAQSSLFRVGVVPGTGSLSTPFTAPTLVAGDLADSFYLQPVFLGGGEIALATPTQLHVLDPSL